MSERRTGADPRPTRAPLGGSAAAPHDGRVADVVLLAGIAALAFGIRVYLPWSTVFAPTHLNLHDTDSWYHLRAIEHFVANFPRHLTWDPYALGGGQWVPLAPLFDVVVGTVAWALGGGHPSDALIARVAVFAPPVLGVLTVLTVYLVGRELGGSQAGLLGATLAAALPGHFLDRTLLGFVDHHALEALLSTAILYVLVRALRPADAMARSAGLLAALLTLYMLAWASGAFLCGVLLIWVMVVGLLGADTPDGRRAMTLIAIAAALALALVWVTQAPGLYRRGSQLVALAALAGLAGALAGGSAAAASRGWPRWCVPAAVIALAVLAGLGVSLWQPAFSRAVVSDLLRFSPSPERMQVMEARPLLFYSGQFSVAPAWQLFRSGLLVGGGGIVALMLRTYRQPTPRHVLLLVWAVSMVAATFGQNRFGYYLVPIVAIIGGWWSSAVIDAGRRAGEWARIAAVVGVAALVFSPSLVPAIWTTGRPTGLRAASVAGYEWLRTSTPEPFGDASYYLARYDPGQARPPAYTVMAWWDAGYWLAQIARRVPVANPTQATAGLAARFYAATTEDEALRVLTETHARYVVAEDDLSFVRGPRNALFGKFESIVVWAGYPTSRFYEQVLVPQRDGSYAPQFAFTADYYRSMGFRLASVGVEGAAPTADSVSVITVTPIRSPGSAQALPTVTAARSFSTYEAAEVYRTGLGPGDHRTVGFDPARTIVPLAPLRHLRVVYASPVSSPQNRAAMRIFEVQPN